MVVKGVSVRLLDSIAHRNGLTTLCGDIGYVFITTDCLEKVYSCAGEEFSNQQDAIIILIKALYGLCSSSHMFRAHFAEFLHLMGFFPTRYDRHVWMHKQDDASQPGYDYICTHMDNFKIVAKKPQYWMDQISGIFLLKSVGPPLYYLGKDYNWSQDKRAWVLECSTYDKECI